MRIEIDRLEIALDGVSAQVAEHAVAGLEGELRRRLASLPLGAAATAVPQLAVGPLDLPPNADAAALRALIAERLLGALVRGQPEDPQEEGGA